MKLMYAVTGDDSATVLLDPSLRERLRAAGATAVQANVPDPAFAGAMSLQSFPVKVTAILSVIAPDDVAITAALEGVALAGGWEVSERIPLAPPEVADGERLSAMANMALLRKPEAMAYDDWLAHWHGPHTKVAIETQDTFGYVQNRVLRTVIDGSEPLAALVEEHFHEAAATDIHVFYGSGGDKAELRRRLDLMVASVTAFGANRDLELLSTARYTWQLG